MPTYAYACTACGHEFDAVQSFSDSSLTDCPQCEGRLRKKFGAVGVVFKGSGFYRTDSRNGAGGSSDKGSSGSSSSDKDSSDKGSSGTGSPDKGSSDKGSSDKASSGSSDKVSAGDKGSSSKAGASSSGSGTSAA